MTSYSHIVVGAGSAGAALASRLSEVPANSVLLIEAGGESTGIEAIEVPPLWPTNALTAVDWGYATEVQPGTPGRSHLAIRGRVVGGSSAINAMVFLRGDRKVFDRWAAQGADGWDYDTILPYFMASETSRVVDPEYRGAEGPLQVGPAEEPNPLSLAFVEASVQAGYESVSDYNPENFYGAALHDLNIVQGRRQSAGDAYLTEPVRNRANFSLLTGTEATRLLFEGTRCIGLEVSANGVKKKVLATEIILSAGAIGSPRLLMLSGIGDAKDLSRLRIPVVVDLPGVGKNLQDHEFVTIVYEASKTVPPPKANLAEASLLWRSSQNDGIADLQIMFTHVPFAPPPFEVPRNGCTFGLCNISSRSVGYVTLRSADPADPPVISPNYFGDDRDIDRMIEGVEAIRKIAASPAFSEWGLREILPGPQAERVELDRLIRALAVPYNHASGTCRMGVGKDSVVDPQLRVRGVQGLRVADASVIPRIPNANTHAVSVMIGEHAAALVSTN